VTPGFIQIWREAIRGKSIARIFVNETLRQWSGELKGLVLDLACGRLPSYRRVLELTDNPRIRLVGVDYNFKYEPSVIADLKHVLPFKDSTAEAVILSEFLYIVENPRDLLQEIHRVLKSEGILLLVAPLVYPHVPEPTDYWRFTGDGLRLLCENAGFAETTIEPIGGRWSSAAYLLSPFLRPRGVVPPLLYWVCTQLDSWTDRRTNFHRCPIGYVVKALA
jgi:SAM-dependent methyltransferase